MDSIRTVDIVGIIRYKNTEGYYHRIDGPSKIWPDGSTEWRINGEYHRLDGPAIECTNGHKEWYINGERHREDGPAVEYSNGDLQYWLSNMKFTKENWEKEVFNRKIKRFKSL